MNQCYQFPYAFLTQSLLLRNRNLPYCAIWVKKIQSLMLRLGESKVFAPYLAELRMKYKAKRNFIKLLDQINV